MTLAVHPAAELFPMMTGEPWEAFVKDIKENGLRESIVLDKEGRVVDGRNRLRACELLGITPETSTYSGDDVYHYVISHNLHRRHLTDSQRAMIAGRIATYRPGRPETTSYEVVSPDLKIADAAALLDVSQTKVQTAKSLLRDGTDKLVALTDEARVPLKTAQRVAATLTPEEQDEYVEKVRAGANPVKAAPPDLQQKAKREKEKEDPRPPPPPKFGGNRRNHVGMVEALISNLDAAAMAFAEIKQEADLDKSVTKEEAVRLTDDLSTQIQGLNRIRTLIRERTK